MNTNEYILSETKYESFYQTSVFLHSDHTVSSFLIPVQVCVWGRLESVPKVKLEPVLCLGMLWAGCVAAGESGPHIPSVQYLKIWHVWHVSDCRVKCVILTRGSDTDCSSFKPISLQRATHTTYIQDVDQLLTHHLHTSSCDIICRLSNLLILKRLLTKFTDLVHFYAYKWNVAPVVCTCRLAKVYSNPSLDWFSELTPFVTWVY